MCAPFPYSVVAYLVVAGDCREVAFGIGDCCDEFLFLRDVFRTFLLGAGKAHVSGDVDPDTTFTGVAVVGVEDFLPGSCWFRGVVFSGDDFSVVFLDLLCGTFKAEVHAVDCASSAVLACLLDRFVLVLCIRVDGNFWGFLVCFVPSSEGWGERVTGGAEDSEVF